VSHRPPPANDETPGLTLHDPPLQWTDWSQMSAPLASGLRLAGAAVELGLAVQLAWLDAGFAWTRRPSAAHRAPLEAAPAAAAAMDVLRSCSADVARAQTDALACAPLLFRLPASGS
jgi:hypothetical protein